jgi:DnaD/phage-associated family protein
LTGEPEPQPRTADDDDDLQPIHPTEAKSSEGQNIFALYAENIGALTPLLRDHLTDALGEFGEEAVRAAIRAAVEYNARHWAYVKACLDGLKGKKVTEQVNRYTSGEFADWVMH